MTPAPFPRSEERARSSSRLRRVLKRVLVVTSVFVVLLGAGGIYAYRHFEGNINAITYDKGELGANRPQKLAAGKNALNILIMGSDTRKGQGPAVQGQTPGLSDTTILLHVSGDRTRAYGVSIPRDTMVQRPDCTTKGGGTDPGGLTQFNAAYSIGGPACTIRTVESITDVRIDHFVVVDFNGFRAMVNALGGVQVCVPTEVNDTEGKIHLAAGTYKVDGEQALDYVRVRHGISANGDIGRMKRQQTFVAAMIQKAVSAGTLANPVKLVRFLDAATKSLSTDSSFAHLSQLVSLGSSLKNIGLDNVKFVTAPWEPYPPDITASSSAGGSRAVEADPHGRGARRRRGLPGGDRRRRHPGDQGRDDIGPVQGRTPRPRRRAGRHLHAEREQGPDQSRQGADRRRERAVLVSVSGQPDPADGQDPERRRRLAEVFGDVLPEQTRDDREPDETSGEARSQDDWLRAQVPPHHGG